MINMNLTGKVALVTGGTSGIGASCVEEFLKNNVKGVIIADINENEEIIKKLNDKYVDGKVVFVKTNVASKDSFQNAFEKTIEYFKQIDILVNSAGIFNEVEWEKMLQINLVGTTHGCLLAINEYFPKYKSSSKAYIINIASIAGILPSSLCPHYVSSKHGIIGLTRSLGADKITTDDGNYVMALCPGLTETPMLQEVNTLADYTKKKEEIAALLTQKPEAVSRSAIQLLEKPQNGSIWVINEGVLSKIDLPVLNNFEKLLVTS